MSKSKRNQYIDLFDDMIASIDLGSDANAKELWDAACDNGKKEIKNDLWNLNRFVSSIQNGTQDEQEHFLLVVNEHYNKNWSNISKHPKLQWLTLTTCSHDNKKKRFHEFIPLKTQKNKKAEFLSELFPNMKRADIETLATITSDKEIKQYCEDLGWDKKAINGIKL